MIFIPRHLMDPSAVPFGNFEEPTQRKKYVIRMKTVIL